MSTQEALATEIAEAIDKTEDLKAPPEITPRDAENCLLSFALSGAAVPIRDVSFMREITVLVGKLEAIAGSDMKEVHARRMREANPEAAQAATSPFGNPHSH